MNLTALEIRYMTIVLLSFEALYPGEEVTVSPSGIRVSFWLTERPDVFVRMESDLSDPFTSPNNPESEALKADILERKAQVDA